MTGLAYQIPKYAT